MRVRDIDLAWCEAHLTGWEYDERTKTGKAWCPCHDDEGSSMKGLAISFANGKPLLFCHSCNAKGTEVLAACNGHVEIAPTVKKRKHTKRIVATYDYGTFQVVRYDPKDFRQRRRVGTQWVWNLDGVETCLYHEDEVREAVARGETIYVVEGEKDVDRLRDEGFVATCNPMGAGKWRDEYSEVLRGASVRVVADHNDAGARHARDVRRSLIGVGCSVRVYEALTGVDVSEHLDAEHTLEELVEVELLDTRSGAIDGAAFILDAPASVSTIWGKDSRAAWVEGESLIICGPQGVGKSTLTQQLALGRIGLRSRLLDLGVAASDSPILYIAADRPSQIRRSFARMVSEDDREVLERSLIVWQGPLPFNLSTQPDEFAPWVAEFGVRTVFIDSLKDVALDLSKDETGSRVNAALQQTLALGIEVVATHHQRKAQANNKKPTSLNDVYGSTWITAGAGSVVLLWADAGDSVVELSHLKQPLDDVGPLQVLHDHSTGTSSVLPEFDVYVAIRQQGGTTVKQFASHLFATDDPSRNQIEKARRRLEAMVTSGEATVVERERSGGGKPERLYRLKEPR